VSVAIVVLDMRVKNRKCAADACESATLVGGLLFILSHTVYTLMEGVVISCLHTNASATNSTTTTTSLLLGITTKMTMLVLFGGAPIFWYALADDIPVMYT